MKLLKNGFAFAIALLTITLTIAAYAGAFKAEPKKNAQVFCNPSVQQTDQLLHRKITDCPLVDPCPNQIPVGQLVGIANTYVGFTCNPGNQFCCATLGEEDECDEIVGQEVLQYFCGSRP